APVGADQDVGGKRLDAVRALDLADEVDPDGASDLELVHELPDADRFLSGVDEDDLKRRFLERFGEAEQLRDLLPAGAAPGREEIDQDDLAADDLGELEVAAVERGEVEIGRDVADPELRRVRLPGDVLDLHGIRLLLDREMEPEQQDRKERDRQVQDPRSHVHLGDLGVKPRSWRQSYPPSSYTRDTALVFWVHGFHDARRER